MSKKRIFSSIKEYEASDSVEHMGFNEPRLRKKYNNRRITLEFPDKTVTFRSIGESKVAQYLQLLKESNHIDDWYYEFMNFKFPNNDKPVLTWLIDFTVKENDGNFYHIEFKGHYESLDRKKLKALFDYYPEARVLYVFQSKHDVKKMGTSRKYLWWRPPTHLSELTRGII